MKLILRKVVENLGEPGDIVDVKPGFGRNYLIPQGLAYEASEGNIKRLEEEKALAEENLAKIAPLLEAGEKSDGSSGS